MEIPVDFSKSLPFSEEENKKLLESLNDSPEISVRLNPFKPGVEFEGEKVSWCERGIYLKERPEFVRDPLFHAGTYYSQEASSMFLEKVFESINTEGIKVLDLCAAPGGKSTHINSLISSNSLLVSNEVIKTRSWILKENLDKWGSSNVVVTNNDPADFGVLEGLFDVVVVDAPCSGEGMFRKDKGARDEWSLKNVDLCCERQQRILAEIIPIIKDGGVLVYSTCTFNSKENEGTLNWIQENFEVENLEFNYPTDQGIKVLEFGNLKGFQFIPGTTRGEGFFLSAMRIYGGRNHLKIPKRIRRYRTDKWEGSHDFLNNENENYLDDGRVISFPAVFEEELKCFKWDLNVVKYGTEIGEEIKGKFKFSHELAFSKDLNCDAFDKVDVGLDDAISFLQKKDLSFLPGIKSWGLVTYRGVALGFIKKVGNRCNNYYPKEFRIRKEFKKG